MAIPNIYSCSIKASSSKIIDIDSWLIQHIGPMDVSWSRTDISFRARTAAGYKTATSVKVKYSLRYSFTNSDDLALFRLTWQ